MRTINVLLYRGSVEDVKEFLVGREIASNVENPIEDVRVLGIVRDLAKKWNFNVEPYVRIAGPMTDGSYRVDFGDYAVFGYINFEKEN